MLKVWLKAKDDLIFKSYDYNITIAFSFRHELCQRYSHFGSLVKNFLT